MPGLGARARANNIHVAARARSYDPAFPPLKKQSYGSSGSPSSLPIFSRCVSVVCGVTEPGPKTKALRILIFFGGGRCWSKEYQKDPRKFKICIIMHKICIYYYYAFF